MFTQAQLDEYIKRLEEAENKIRVAEARIAERDQRIIEVERLLDCMGTVRHTLHLQIRLHRFVHRFADNVHYNGMY